MMRDTRSTSRGRPCGARREGNVLPVTSLDRHTGRAALATSELPLFAANTNATDTATVGDSQHPAGSRDLNWRSPSAVEATEEPGEGESDPSAGSPLTGLFLRSYSESKCTTQAPCEEPPSRLRRIGFLTKTFRAERAMRHRGRARYMIDTGRPSVAEFHLRRAEGQRKRIENVEACGTREVVLSCQDCGHQLRKSIARCGHHRLCVVCRGHRARRYRLKIRIARRRALEEFALLRKRRWMRLEWRERFLSLTIPHSGDVRQDLRSLPEAWKLFRRWLWHFFQHEHGLDKELLGYITYVRVTEVTGGRKDEGHAHYHVYFHSPYIPHELVRHLWGKALNQLGYVTPTRPTDRVLAEAHGDFAATQLKRLLVTRRGKKGRLLAEVEWPVLDIREANSNVEQELVKYLVKDAAMEGGKLQPIPDELLARIYEGLEGLRAIATSRTLFQDNAKSCACDECGSTRLTRVAAQPPDTNDVPSGQQPESRRGGTGT